IARTNPPPADFLDAGCSFGGFVAAAERAGYRARGLDLSDFAVQEGLKRGRALQKGPVARDTFDEASFDVITLIEVMEHLPNPQLAAQSLFRWLRSGGLAVIQTANFQGWQARSEGSDYHYYLPGHLYYYSAENLKTLLRAAGFCRFKLFRPVDFPLSAKLRKMSLAAYPEKAGWKRKLQTSYYHLKGKLHLGSFSLTSSMVLYAWKA
ncbi:MAG: class I SAM-dependent methyltransferase, partial [Leptospiraceae bacterium]|nr:class I SAM-dependent methyltransferase [Leptospiraceae bacterium]